MRGFLDPNSQQVAARKWEAIPADRRRRWSMLTAVACMVVLGANALWMVPVAGIGITALAETTTAVVLLPFVALLGFRPSSAFKWGAMTPWMVAFGGLAVVTFAVIRA